MYRLRFNAKKIFRATCFIIVGLVMMDVITRWSFSHFKTPTSEHVKDFFDLDNEHNVPSVLSFLQLAIASVVLAVLASLSAQKKEGRTMAWGVLSVVFAYLSLDELEGFHERMLDYFRNTFHTTGILYHAWIIPMLAFAVVLGAIYLPFLYKLPARTRNGIMIAGLGYVASAAGGDMISGEILTKFPSLVEHRAITIENIFEEAGEMLSIAYFIFVLLSYMRDHVSDQIMLTLTGKKQQMEDMLPTQDGQPNLRVINVEKKAQEETTK